MPSRNDSRSVTSPPARVARHAASQLAEQRGQRTDRFQHRTLPDDWRKVLRHPDTLKVADALGYDFEHTDTGALSSRYFKPKRLKHYLADWRAMGRRLVG